MYDLCIVIAILILTAVMAVLVLRRRVSLAQEAVSRVITILRQNDCSRNPKTLDQLGLQLPASLIQLGGQKDYRPLALHYLIEADVVRVMEDERICLIDENLGEESSYKAIQTLKDNEDFERQAQRILQFPIIRHSNQNEP